jgi:hypothetical protein
MPHANIVDVVQPSNDVVFEKLANAVVEDRRRARLTSSFMVGVFHARPSPPV